MAGLSTRARLTRSPGKLPGLVVLAIGSQRGTTWPEPPLWAIGIFAVAIGTLCATRNSVP
jgi:hypothetical protein